MMMRQIATRGQRLATALTACWMLWGSLAGRVEPLQAADLVYPLDAAVDAKGDIVVVDRKLPGVVRLQEESATVIAEGSKKFREPLNAPWCVAIDAEGRVLVGDSASRAVYRLDGTADLKKVNTSYVGLPIRMAVDDEGRIYVSDLETERIWRFPKEGGEAEEFAIAAGVRGLCVDDQNRLWTVRANPPQIVRYTAEGNAETILEEGPFEFPHQIAVRGSGETAYVSDGYAQCIWKLEGDGAPVKWAVSELMPSPTGMTLAGEDLLVADPKARAVLRVDAAGQVSRRYPPMSP